MRDHEVGDSALLCIARHKTNLHAPFPVARENQTNQGLDYFQVMTHARKPANSVEASCVLVELR